MSRDTGLAPFTRMTMNRQFFRCISVVSFVLLSAAVEAQVGVLGITDRNYGGYPNQATFLVTNEAGYSYDARLDGNPVPTGVPVTVQQVDYHEIFVWRTNVSTLQVATQLVRFIVHNSARRTGGSTEDGLPSWTPYPPINSTAAEFAGGHLRLLVPQDFPTGYPIPVIGWVENDQGHAIRTIGMLSADGHPSIKIKRGVGSGFLGATNPAGSLVYSPQIGGLTDTRVVNLESGTAWTTVSAGTLPANTVWPAGSRIQITGSITNAAGSTLTIGAGTIVRLSANVDIANNGAIVITGTTNQPVVFMPATTGQPWGGFIQHASNASFTAAGAIFTGCGGVNPCWFLGHDCSTSLTGISSHRGEQALISLNGTNCNLTLSDSAAIFMTGQFSHALGGSTKGYTITLTRFLLQRCTTGGEFTGARFNVNDSAFIECNEDLATGEGPTFVDADNDGLYIVDAAHGPHGFTNTLWGWTWDDGVDSGGSGSGQLNFQDCWFDSIYHEANSLSGTGKDSRHFGDVMLNCGQAIECGYDSPTGRVDHCLIANNLIGVRFGDNYAPPSYTYGGFQWATNSISIHNYRDVWGFNWQDWAYRTSAMDVRSNLLTAASPFHPANSVWNPIADAWRLTNYSTTPAGSAVGIGIATWTNQFTLTNLFLGVPVGLSCFTTNFVEVSYSFVDGVGASLADGTLIIPPGQTLKRVFPVGFDVSAQATVRLVLRQSVHGELTGVTNVSFVGAVPAPQVTCWVSTNLLAGYRMPEGMLVRLTAPSGLPVDVSYTYTAAAGVQAAGSLNFAPGEVVKRISAAGVGGFEWVRLDLGNPSGASLAGITSITYTNPPRLVRFGATNELSLGTFTSGLPVVLNVAAPADGVTVDFAFEGNGALLTNGTLTFTQGQTAVQLVAPTIDPQAYDALRVILRNATGAALGLPATVYYLRTAGLPVPSPILVASNSAWRYLDTGVDPGTAWRSPLFSDNTWSNGLAQLGFGDNDERTVIRRTTSGGTVIISFYFRQQFVISNAAAYTNLTMWLLRDDGGVVYVNGTEAYRSPSMPQAPTPITYQTFATNQSISSAPPDNTVDVATLSTNLIANGTNVVAVEIHQHDNTSSDVSFDLALTGNARPASTPPAPIITSPTNGQEFASGLFSVTVAATNAYTNMVLFADTLLVGQSASAPFTFNVSGLSPGSHDLIALGSDAAGNVVASAPVTISVAASSAPLLSTAVFSAGSGTFSFGFSAAANASYSVLYADTIPTNVWAKLQDIAAAPTNRTVTVTNNTAAPQRFYKLVTPAQ